VGLGQKFSLTVLVLGGAIVLLCYAVISQSIKEMNTVTSIEIVKVFKAEQAQKSNQITNLVEQKTNAVLGILQTSTGELVNNFNTDALNAIIASIVADTDFDSVVFYDTEDSALTDETKIKSEIILEKELLVEGEAVGKVKIGINQNLVKQIQKTTERESQKTLASIQSQKDAASSDLINSSVFTIILSILILTVLIAGYFSVAVLKPIKKTSELLREIAEGEGDLTCRLEKKSKDEIGELSEWFNLFISKIQNIIREVQANAHELSNQTSRISVNIESLNEGSHNIEDRISDVHFKTANLEQNIKSMADTADSIAGEMSTVCSSTENVNERMFAINSDIEVAESNVSDIAKASKILSNFSCKIYNCAENGGTIAVEASQVMLETEAQTKQLSSSCESIENIVAIIGEISEQTKNLALNATIEAARAGEAGKGFAVVANEVKELAKQTGEATENIVETINAMRQSTESTSQRIHHVGEVVSKQTEIVQEISELVNKQSEIISDNHDKTNSAANQVKMMTSKVEAASNEINEITESLDKVTKSSSAVSTATDNSFKETAGVSKSISNIKSSSEQNNKKVDEINDSISEVESMATKLSGLVDRFLV
jgi:methyl-accepting chemotaxis protein